MPHFLILLNDDELQVKLQALKSVACFSGKVEEYLILEKVVPHLSNVVSSEDVNKLPLKSKERLTNKEHSLTQ